MEQHNTTQRNATQQESEEGWKDRTTISTCLFRLNRTCAEFHAENFLRSPRCPNHSQSRGVGSTPSGSRPERKEKEAQWLGLGAPPNILFFRCRGRRVASRSHPLVGSRPPKEPILCRTVATRTLDLSARYGPPCRSRVNCHENNTSAGHRFGNPCALIRIPLNFNTSVWHLSEISFRS